MLQPAVVTYCNGGSRLSVSTYTEDSSRRGNDARSRRDIRGDHGVRTDGRTVTDTDPAQDDTTNPKPHCGTDLRGVIQARGRVDSVAGGESDVMVKHTVVADDAFTVYHNTVLMVEPDAPPQTHRLVDLEA